MELIKYTPESIEKACEEGKLILVSFRDEWAGVEPVILVKHTAKCIWPQNTTDARFDKENIGKLHWGKAYCIDGDQDQVIDEYYDQMIAQINAEMNRMIDRRNQMANTKNGRLIYHRDPESKRWIK